MRDPGGGLITGERWPIVAAENCHRGGNGTRWLFMAVDQGCTFFRLSDGGTWGENGLVQVAQKNVFLRKSNDGLVQVAQENVFLRKSGQKGGIKWTCPGVSQGASDPVRGSPV